MCGAGLLLEPIKEADPAGHVLSARTESRLSDLLQAHVRLVDSGEVGVRTGRISVSPPYEVPVAPMPVAAEEESDVNTDMMEVMQDMMEASVEVPLTNVRPRFVTSPRYFVGDATPVPLPLGRLTVAACPTGVLVTRGWQDGRGGGGMSARRLSFLP